MKKLLLMFGLTMVGLFAQSTLQLSGPVSARPNATFNLNVTLAGTTTPTALQFNLTGSSDITAVTGTIGAAGTAASKQIACNSYTAGVMTCVVYGLNQNQISSGVVATLSVTLSSAPANSSETLTLTGTVGSNPTGSSVITITVAGSPDVVGVLSNCDLNGDGVTNAADVALMITWILGTTPPVGLVCAVNGSTCNVTDVQIIVDASLGLACTAVVP